MHCAWFNDLMQCLIFWWNQQRQGYQVRNHPHFKEDKIHSIIFFLSPTNFQQLKTRNFIKLWTQHITTSTIFWPKQVCNRTRLSVLKETSSKHPSLVVRRGRVGGGWGGSYSPIGWCPLPLIPVTPPSQCSLEIGPYPPKAKHCCSAGKSATLLIRNVH